MLDSIKSQNLVCGQVFLYLNKTAKIIFDLGGLKGEGRAVFLSF
jgi:hypothetical protein